eukprot:5649251-Ditylum_brightwellii.AAC.1
MEVTRGPVSIILGPLLWQIVTLETNTEPKEGEKKEEEEKRSIVIESPDKKQQSDDAEWMVEVQGIVAINNYFVDKKE